MGNGKQKINYAIIQQDECGRDVMFYIPQAALHYAVRFHPLANEMMIDIQKEKLFIKAESMAKCDLSEQMIFTVEDKVDYVRWVKKVCKVKKVEAV